MEESNVKRIICPHCNKNISGLYLCFCPNCGEALSSTDLMEMGYDTSNAGMAKEKSFICEKTNNIKGVGILGIVAVFILLSVGIHNLALSNNKELVTNEPVNISEQALEVKDYSTENTDSIYPQQIDYSEYSTENTDSIYSQQIDYSGDSDSNYSNSSEYVKTIYIYAEQGAVVTWYDSETGAFKFKPKCEECGQVSNSERHIGQGLTNSMSSYTSSFSCTNSKCSMWGKSQKIVIGCEASGEWVH